MNSEEQDLSTLAALNCWKFFIPYLQKYSFRAGTTGTVCIDPEWCGTPEPAAFTQQSIPPCAPPQFLHTPVHPPALL